MDQEIKVPTNKIRSVSFLSLSMIIHASLAVTALFMNSDNIQQFPEEKPAFLQNSTDSKNEIIEISTVETSAMPAQELNQDANAAVTSPNPAPTEAATAAEIAEITQNLEPKIKQDAAQDSEIIIPAKAAAKPVPKVVAKAKVKKELPVVKAKAATIVRSEVNSKEESRPEVSSPEVSEPVPTAAKVIEVTNDDSDVEQAQKDLDEEQSKVEAEQNEKLQALEKEHEEEEENFLAEQKQKRDAQEAAAMAEIKAQQEQEALAVQQAERKEKVKALALAKYEAQERKKAALAAQKAEEQRQASLQAAQEAAATAAAQQAAFAAAKQAAEESFRNSAGGGSNFAHTSEQTGSEIRSLAELRQMPGNKRPAYDSEDRLQKRTGEIVFLAFISKEGNPTEFKLVKSTGHRSLDAKTLKTVKQWKFYPGQEGWVEIPLNWNLKGEAQEMPSTLRRKVSQN